MDELRLLADLHKDNARQGPGGDRETRRAIELAGIDGGRPLKIADIGCGTGASTLLLAEELNAEFIAVDFLPEFLDRLRSRARVMEVDNRISTVTCSMDALPFEDEDFDVVWSDRKSVV